MPRSRRSADRLHDVILAVALTAIGLAWVRAEWEPIRQRAGRIPGWSIRFPRTVSGYFWILAALVFIVLPIEI